MESIAGRQRWIDVTIEQSQISQITDVVTLLVSRATATRTDDEPYSTWVTSVYVSDGGSWKLAFHQQTPDQMDLGTTDGN